MNPEYILGIKDIDEQHEEIDVLTDSLCDAIKSGQDVRHVLPLLVRFYDLLDTHFALEESVMLSLSYPEVQAHRLEHQSILGKVAGFRECAERGEALQLDEIKARQLFILHVLEFDQPFAAFVRTRHVL